MKSTGRGGGWLAPCEVRSAAAAATLTLSHCVVNANHGSEFELFMHTYRQYMYIERNTDIIYYATNSMLRLIYYSIPWL